jgi:hypothetical protein
MISDEIRYFFESQKAENGIPEEAGLKRIEKRIIEISVDNAPGAKDGRVVWENRMAWVGTFILHQKVWEIALGMQGKLLRVERSA